MESPKYNLKGQRIGRLLVLLYVGAGKWKCRCDCGNKVITTSGNLRAGKTKSCGCLRRGRWFRHGLHGTAEYRVWQGIKRRCRPNDPDAQYYANAGVTICSEWAESFQAFYDYVGPRPSAKHSIDRYPDPFGSYEPGNVRWATASEQRKNQRRGGRMLTLNGKTQHISEWATELNINDTMIIKRLTRGWTIEQSLYPEPKHGKKLTPETVRAIRAARGSGSLGQIGLRFGVCKQTVLDIQRGKTWKHI